MNPEVFEMYKLACLISGAAPGGTPANTGFVIAGAGANIAGGSDPWNTPGNITADDGVETAAGALAVGQSTQTLYASNFDFSGIPDGATIDGITVRIQRRKQSGDATQVDLTVRLTKDGTNNAGDDNRADTVTAYTTTATNADYGGATDLWSTTWTAAEVKASTFGVFFRAQCTVGTTGGNCRVDAIWVQVDYTA